MKYIYLVLITLIFACGNEHDASLPQCDFVTQSRSDKGVCIKINSTEHSVRMCRDFGTRISCYIIEANYFQCITIESNAGEVITFENELNICQLIIN